MTTECPMRMLLLLMLMLMMLTMMNEPQMVLAVPDKAPPGYFKEYGTRLEGGLDWIFLGSEMDIPCIPVGMNKLVVSEPIYSWSNNTNHIGITMTDFPSWRMKADTGTLVVKNAKLEQTGRYFCTLRSRSKRMEAVHYEHHLLAFIVYQLPTYSMKWEIFHMTKRCDDKARYKNYVKDVLKMLCLGTSDCAFNFTYVSCIPIGLDTSRTKWDIMKDWTSGKYADLLVRFEMRQRPATSFRLPSCDVICMTKNVQAHLESEHKEKIETFKKMNRDVYRESMGLTFMEKMMTSKLEGLCTEGYEPYKMQVCVPCAPGRYKTVGDSSACKLCAYFDYQDDYATLRCKSCPLFKLSGKSGSTTVDDCYWYHKNAVFWVCIVAGFVVLSLPMSGIVWVFWRMKDDDSWLMKKCDNCLSVGGFGETTKQKKYNYRKDQADDLPVLFEAPGPAKKKATTKQPGLPPALQKALDKKREEVKLDAKKKAGDKEPSPKTKKKKKEEEGEGEKEPLMEKTTADAADGMASPLQENPYYFPYAYPYPYGGEFLPPPPGFGPPPPPGHPLGYPDPMMNYYPPMPRGKHRSKPTAEELSIPGSLEASDDAK